MKQGLKKSSVLIEKINRQREVKARMDEVVSKLTPADYSYSQLSQAAADVRLRLESHLHRYGPENTLSTQELSIRKSLQEALAEAQPKALKAKAHKEQLRSEYESLKTEFMGANSICNEADLLAVNAEFFAAKAEVDKLDRAIKVQQEVISETQKESHNLPALVRQRQEILASLATDEKPNGDLEAIEQEIQLVEAELAKSKQVIDQAEQATAGLQIKLASAKQLAQDRQRDLTEAISYYLAGRALAIESDYACLASGLQEKCEQLLGLGKLLEQSAPESFPGRITSDMGYNFRIPRFFLPTGGEEMKTSVQANQFDIASALEKEKTHLEEIGIKI